MYVKCTYVEVLNKNVRILPLSLEARHQLKKNIFRINERLDLFGVSCMTREEKKSSGIEPPVNFDNAKQKKPRIGWPKKRKPMAK